ncbi:MAG TPA: hypothetical protein VF898_10165 [Chloroflexota bacterium]
MKTLLFISILAFTLPSAANAATLQTSLYTAPAPICIPGILPDRLDVSGSITTRAKRIHRTLTVHRTVVQDYTSACSSFLSRRGAAVSCPKSSGDGHLSLRFSRRGKELLTFTAGLRGCWWLAVQGRADLGTAPLLRTPFLPLLLHFIT